jgi:uncharacterized protein (DUF1778 family)
MKLNVVKGALVPANDDARQELNKKTKLGQVIEVELVNERNTGFNAKVFTTIAEIAKMLDVDPDEFRAEIIYETGRGKDIALRAGKAVVTVLPSMSKHSMTQAELEAFWEDARAYILKEVMVSLDADQQERVLEMLGATREDERKAVNPLAGG